jgi:glycosyltransferase involved in cell wall biosynthesis
VSVPAVGDPAPAPPPLRSEDEIVARWQGGDPVVTCICNTYNHVGFIGDALRGMLGQVTGFPFEIIVHDDASTDGTADVVRDFAARYPRIVRPVFQSVNQYAVTKPITFTLPLARGEFLAWCEGDDYWLDPHKLERQVGRLRADRDAVLSHHDVLVIEDGLVIAGPDPRSPSDLSSSELRRGRFVPVCSWLFRRAALNLDFLPYCRTPVNGDKFILSALGLHGGSAFASDVGPAVYRHHSGGVWSSRSLRQRRIIMARNYYWLYRYHRERTGEADVARFFLTRLVKVLVGTPPKVLRVAWHWVRGFRVR